MPIISAMTEVVGTSTSSDERGHRTHTLVARYFFDDRQPYNSLVCWAAGAARHAPCGFDPLAFLKSKNAEFEAPYLGTGSTYLLTETYSTDTPSFQWPWEEDPQIDCDSIEEEKIFEVDQAGAAVVNSLNRRWEPGPTTPSAKPVLRIQKNFQTPAVPTWLSYSFTTNDATFLGGAEDSWLMRPIKWSKQNAFIDDVKVYFYRLSIEMVYKADLWYPRKILDSGYAYKVGGQIVAARNDDLSPATQPVLLDGTGQKTNTPHYREFDEFEQKDFTYFGVTSV